MNYEYLSISYQNGQPGVTATVLAKLASVDCEEMDEWLKRKFPNATRLATGESWLSKADCVSLLEIIEAANSEFGQQLKNDLQGIFTLFNFSFDYVTTSTYQPAVTTTSIAQEQGISAIELNKLLKKKESSPKLERSGN